MLSSKVYEKGELDVAFTVKNTGDVSGAEISQVYIKNPEGKFMRASRELVGFSKNQLDVGASKKVSVKLNERSFSIYNVEKSEFQISSGSYQIMVGASLNDIRLVGEVQVLGEAITLNQTVDFSEYFNKSMDIKSETFKRLMNKNSQKDFDKIAKGDYTIHNSMNELAKVSLLSKIVKFVLTKAVYHMNKGTKKTDPAVVMIVTGMQEGPLVSVMTASEGAVPMFLAESMLLSANGYHMKAISRLFKRK